MSDTHFPAETVRQQLIREHGADRVERSIELARITTRSLYDWLDMPTKWFDWHYSKKTKACVRLQNGGESPQK